MFEGLKEKGNLNAGEFQEERGGNTSPASKLTFSSIHNIGFLTINNDVVVFAQQCFRLVFVSR